MSANEGKSDARVIIGGMIGFIKSEYMKVVFRSVEPTHDAIAVLK